MRILLQIVFWSRNRGWIHLAVHDFLGQLYVTFGAAGADIIEQRRLAIARRLGKADVARNDGFQQPIAKVSLQLLCDLLRQVRSIVIHGEDHAFNVQLRVKAQAQSLNRVQ